MVTKIKKCFFQNNMFPTCARMETWMRGLMRAYHVFSICFSLLNEVDSLLPTTRYTLLRAASWKQSAEGCSWPDHRGTTAVHAAGGTFWHAAPGSTWPAQVGQVLTLNEHIWGPGSCMVLLILLLSLPGSITSMQERLRWQPAWRSNSLVKRRPLISSWIW